MAAPLPAIWGSSGYAPLEAKDINVMFCAASKMSQHGVNAHRHWAAEKRLKRGCANGPRTGPCL